MFTRQAIEVVLLGPHDRIQIYIYDCFRYNSKHRIDKTQRKSDNKKAKYHIF